MAVETVRVGHQLHLQAVDLLHTEDHLVTHLVEQYVGVDARLVLGVGVLKGSVVWQISVDIDTGFVKVLSA